MWACLDHTAAWYSCTNPSAKLSCINCKLVALILPRRLVWVCSCYALKLVYWGGTQGSAQRWNWGGTQGSAQWWNWGGTAVGCGGTGVELKGVLRGGTGVGQRWAVVEQRRAGTQKETVQIPAHTCRWNTETNCTNTNTITKQNQLQNKTNYETKPITHSKPIQQQINSIPTQNQFNTFTTITNSMQTQSNHKNSIQLNQLHQTQLNQTCTSSMYVTDECEVCWECMFADKTNRNKLYK